MFIARIGFVFIIVRPSSFSSLCSCIDSIEVGIYNRTEESMKTRIHVFDQESNQEKKKKRKKTRSRPRNRSRIKRKNDNGKEKKKKENTPSTKKETKKKRIFFLIVFLVDFLVESVFSFLFSYFLVFFLKFSPLLYWKAHSCQSIKRDCSANLSVVVCQSIYSLGRVCRRRSVYLFF